MQKALPFYFPAQRKDKSSFPQVKRACLSGRQVGNPSEKQRKIPDKPE